jgi:hypothetical protein
VPCEDEESCFFFLSELTVRRRAFSQKAHYDTVFQLKPF